MHCKYMGVDQYFARSVLVVSCFIMDILGCTIWQDRHRKVWALCLRYCKDHQVDAPSRYTRITGNMFTTPAHWRTRFPKLKGKAGQIKHLLPALLYAFDCLRDPTDERHSMIRVALQSSLKVDRNIDQCPGSIRRPREASEELIMHGITYLNTYT